ncbi:MAG: hypothetical protein V1722_00245 [Candidatus Micrarchaeota archaeon]
MHTAQRVREVIERQQYDDLLFWKNPLLLREKGRLAKGAEVHGSALSIHNKGIIISGKSESGKTTTWFNLLRHGGKAISEDLTNLVFTPSAALLISPGTRHAFRIHGKYHRRYTSQPAYGEVGQMKSGGIIPKYIEAPMDPTAQQTGRPLHAVFYIEKQRLHPRAYPRVVLMDENKLVHHFQSEDTSTFPSSFDLPETHTRESIRRLSWKRKEEIAQRVVQQLRKVGVNFFQVYVPETKEAKKQALTATAISKFARGFVGGFKPGLNLLAISHEHSGKVFPISRSTVIGTAGDIRLKEDKTIASRHTAFEKIKGKWTARDLGTKAHTHILKKERVEAGKVDWRRLKGTMEIQDGDLLAIGHTFVQVVIK